MLTGTIDKTDGSLATSLDVQAPYQVFAGSALLDYTPNPHVRLQAGLRFDYWNLTGNQHAEPGVDPGATSFPAASPRLALILKPDGDNVIKLLAGSAFRAPSAYEFFYNDGGTTQVTSTVCGAKLSPENIYSVEAELTHRFDLD